MKSIQVESTRIHYKENGPYGPFKFDFGVWWSTLSFGLIFLLVSLGIVQIIQSGIGVRQHGDQLLKQDIRSLDKDLQEHAEVQDMHKIEPSRCWHLKWQMSKPQAYGCQCSIHWEYSKYCISTGTWSELTKDQYRPMMIQKSLWNLGREDLCSNDIW